MATGTHRGKIRVGVLRGGMSHEYDMSLKTGGTVLRHFPDSIAAEDILVSKDGLWHVGGVPKTPEKALQGIDVVFNALHGRFGEDGKVQTILEHFNIPYTGSRPVPASISMNKALAKRRFQEEGIKTPLAVIFHPRDHVRRKVMELFQSFPQPSVIKPLWGGSSIGVVYARDFQTFEQGIENVLRHGGMAIVEEYIPGKESTVSILESGEGDGSYSLFPVEIRKGENEIFNYEMRSGGGDEQYCPGKFSKKEKRALQELALQAHRALGLRHYSSADFIIHPKRGIFLIEVDALPHLSDTSSLSKSLDAAGLSMKDFLDHVVRLALR
jgi:D-alanine-D-alanine ligase